MIKIKLKIIWKIKTVNYKAKFQIYKINYKT